MSDVRVKWRDWRRMRLIRGSAAFDPDWYLGKNPDVAEAGIDPLVHFVKSGACEGRWPNPIFDVAWYVDQYGPADGRGFNPLVDYLLRKPEGGRKPNRWFDPQWYRATYSHAPTTMDPMVHFLKVGGEEGCLPGPDFPQAGLVRRHPDLGGYKDPLSFYLQDCRATACVQDCTSHYVSGWVSRPRDNASASINILVNGEVKGTVVPRVERPDVEALANLVGLGFHFEFQERLRHGDTVELRDEFCGDMLGYTGLGRSTFGCSTSYLIPPVGTATDFLGNRAALAAEYLGGHGVEVGAFNQPTDLSPDCSVVYYDKFEGSVLRDLYDETCQKPLMEPSYTGDAESLDGLPDATFDFLIANHVIEHLPDPIRFLKSVAEKLKLGGRAMLAAPDKRFSFDVNRKLTSFDHLVDDHELGAERSRVGHFTEWAEVVQGLRGEAAARWIAGFGQNDMPIHYHVWDAATFVDFVTGAIDRYGLALSLVGSFEGFNEAIVVLEKSSPQSGAAGQTGTPSSAVNDNYTQNPPSRQNIIDIFKGSWISILPGDRGLSSGGVIPLFEDARITSLIERLGGEISQLTCLELGPFEGGHSFMLHQAGIKSLVAVEGHSVSYLKSLLVKEVFDLHRVAILHGEIETWLRQEEPRFDVVLASGVFYHFLDPLAALHRLSLIASHIYIWTHYVQHSAMPSDDPRWKPFTGERKRREVAGFEGQYHFRSYEGAEGSAAFCGGIRKQSVWMEHSAFVGALECWGFTVEELHVEPDHVSGPASCFYARKAHS